MWKVMQVDNETLQAQLTQAEQQIAALQHKCQQLEDDKAALRQEMQAQQQSSSFDFSALEVQLAQLKAAAQQQHELYNASLQASCASLGAQLQHAQQQAYAAHQAHQQLHHDYMLLQQWSAKAEEWSREAVAQAGALQCQVQQLQDEVIGMTSCVDGLITVGRELLSDRGCRISIRVAPCFEHWDTQDSSLAGVIRQFIIADLMGAEDICINAQGPSSFSRPQHSAAATPAAPQLLLLEPRTPNHSQHLCDPPCSRSSSSEHLTLLLKGGEDAAEFDSSHWAGGSC
jgi:hypothetical protein